MAAAVPGSPELLGLAPVRGVEGQDPPGRAVDHGCVLARGQEGLAHTAEPPQPRRSRQLPAQQRAKGKGRVPMGTESADISKLKKERSGKVRAQQDAVDMAEGGSVLPLPSAGLQGKILLKQLTAEPRLGSETPGKVLFTCSGCFNSGQLPARLIFVQGCIVQPLPDATLKEMERPRAILPRHLSPSCKMIEINKAN